jgi:hypothetical protein
VSGTVDANTIGSYMLTYSVADRDGNTATATREVDVVDSLPPALTLLGASPMALPLGRAFVEPGATAYDAHDGDLTARIVVKGTVDASRAGLYSLTYTVRDNSGNVASLTRQVGVYAPPVVTCWTATTQLSWNSGGFSDVGLGWRVDSGRAMATTICSVTQDEGLSATGSGAHDAELTFEGNLPSHLWLRNARIPKGDGRVYLISITVVDDLGQVGRGFCCVIVPKGGSARQLDDVRAQAAADLAAGQALIVDSFGQPRANG